MSIKIGKDLFWLCTKSGDIIFRNVKDAADYVAEAMLEMTKNDEWEQSFFEGLVKVERRKEKFIVTTVSEEMWKQATIKLWKAKDKLKESWDQEEKEILDKTKMEVVRQIDKSRGRDL